MRVVAEAKGKLRVARRRGRARKVQAILGRNIRNIKTKRKVLQVARHPRSRQLSQLSIKLLSRQPR